MSALRLRRALAAVIALAVVGAVGACGGDSSAEGSKDAGGTTLRIGYQRFGGLSLVKARGTAKNVTWSLFESGPALTEALKAGSIDLGETGEAPPIFAAAAKTDFKIVASSEPVPNGEAVLVHEADGYKTFGDLKGKKVALNKGSNVNWLLVKLLEKYDLKITDVDVRYLKPAEARPAFDNHQVDAWIIWDPYFALAEQPGVKVLEDATGLANNREYILAAPDAVKDNSAALQSFLSTYQETTEWGIAHPDERAAALSPELKIPLDTTTRALERSARKLTPVTPEIADEIQQIADGFTELKLIPGSVDIKSRVDNTYDSALG